MNTKRQLKIFGAGIFLALAMVSCYPGGAEYTSDTDIVVTNYNPNFDFGAVKTYYLADSVSYVLPEGEEADHALDAFIVAEMESSFADLGWERVDSTYTEQPDVAVTLSAIRVTNYNIYSVPWYPGWGWGWYWKSSDETSYWGYPGYGWGYPWYGYTYVTSYDVGTLVWYLFDPDNVDEENEVIYLEWQGAINGVMGSSVQNTKDRITRGVRQGFKQSPYLSGE